MATTHRKGRPGQYGNSKFHEKKLHQLLVDKLPSEFVRENRVDTKRLAEATGHARFTVYRWLNTELLSRMAMMALLTVSEETKEKNKCGALTVEDLTPFVLGR